MSKEIDFELYRKYYKWKKILNKNFLSPLRPSMLPLSPMTKGKKVRISK